MKILKTAAPSGISGIQRRRSKVAMVVLTVTI
jgi:hypothetical protein